jgi:N-acetylneuraminate synthase/sialic acid synthase
MTMRDFSIDGTPIGDDTDCYVIAEIGHNHQGDLSKAKQMFREARDAGVNAVKLQKRDNRSLFTRALYDKPYDNENSFGATYGEHREALEFGRDEYVELQRYARELGVTMFATAFDVPSADFLEELDMPAFKLASGDLTNLPLLRHVASFQKPLILSTGGASLDDVRRASYAVLSINPQLCLLQCTANYPTPPEEMHLAVIGTLRREFPGLVVGLSDHYNGISMAVAAFVLGARVIEKHFTLNHTMKGTDHALSLEPIGMTKMVRDLRRTRAALGDGVKRQLPSETSALNKMGKSLVASRDLPAGHVLTAADIAIKSPGGGLAPYLLDSIIGQPLPRAVKVDDQIPAEAAPPAGNGASQRGLNRASSRPTSVSPVA